MPAHAARRGKSCKKSVATAGRAIILIFQSDQCAHDDCTTALTKSMPHKNACAETVTIVMQPGDLYHTFNAVLIEQRWC